MDKWIKKLAVPFPKLRAALSHRPNSDIERRVEPSIIEGMSYYNLGFTLEQSCSFLKQKSGNASSGNYMNSVDGHKIYLKTGRDFSSLIGKQVNVIYTGDIKVPRSRADEVLNLY